ncbi:MAG: hypothetical protein KJO81_08115 [Gammaproteobacteria bacterium]|nr:hypothetical protein [Gammaproteobacteria bacterium]NNC68015.1 hypothetical protein [Gammaproteobacteria bacterium]
MEEINIQAKGITLNKNMINHIRQRLHSVFGFNQYEVQKIVITLFDEERSSDDIANRCHIEVKIRNQPSIITELVSFDIFTATTLAIERAHLKISRRLMDNKIMHKQIELSKRISSF